MALELVWQQVKDPADRRRVVYWRLVGPDGRSAGAILRHPKGWQARRYDRARGVPWSTKPDIVDLGRFPSKQRAQAAVERAAREVGA